MTPRENLLKTLRHEPHEWIPVAGHCDPYNQPHRRGMDPVLAEKLKHVQWMDESTVILSRYLGLDVMDFYCAPLRCRQREVTTEQQRDGDIVTTTWHTPAGDLREVTRYSGDTGLWYTLEHQVKEVDDLPALAALFADQEFSVDEDGVQALRQRAELVGEDGLVMAAMTGTPLGQLVRVHSGVENLAYLWADGRAELHALFAVMEENHLRQYRLAAPLPGLDVLICMDDTSTTTISPAMFEECCLDYTDHLADVMHAAGKFYFHHSCGLIRDLLALYRQTKMDAVHAYQIPPMGDVTIAAGKPKLGDQITMIVSLVQMCDSLDDRAAVARSIAQMFDEAQPGDGIIMGMAPDPGKDMEETTFVAQECLKHRRLV